MDLHDEVKVLSDQRRTRFEEFMIMCEQAKKTKYVGHLLAAEIAQSD